VALTTATEGDLLPGSAAQPDRVLARRLALCSVLAVAAAALCYLVMVRTSLGQRFDNAAYLGAQDQVASLAAGSSSDLRRITADSLAVVLAGLVLLGALRHRLLRGLGAAFAAGVAVVGTHVLKLDILTRPALNGLVYAAPNTFPSGHTATAVACAMALVLVAPPRWRGPAAVVAGAYGWVTAAQVQTAGGHQPSDAVGAALLAFAAVTGVGALLAWYRPVTPPSGRGHRVSQSALGVVAAAALAVCAWGFVEVLGYLSGHAQGWRVPAGFRYDAYITGVAVTVEVVVVLLMILLALVGRPDLGARGSSGA